MDNNYNKLNSIKDILLKSFPNKRILCNEENSINGLKTGFNKLDKLTFGLQPASLTVIGGRPSMGKTSLLLTMLNNIIHSTDTAQPKTVVLFSLETPAELLTDHLLCIHSNVNIRNFKAGSLTESEWKALWKANTTLQKTNLYIDDSCAITAKEIRERIKNLKATNNIDLVAIDSLQLITASTPKPQREYVLDEIARELKQIAAEFNIPIVVTSQLNRNLEKRSVKRPLLYDLCATNNIANYADLVLLLYREDYYNLTTEYENIAELIVAKNRYGLTDTIYMFYKRKNYTFIPLDLSIKKNQ